MPNDIFSCDDPFELYRKWKEEAIVHELNDPDAPGETLALMETIGLNNVELKKFPYASRVSYFKFT